MVVLLLDVLRWIPGNQSVARAYISRHAANTTTITLKQQRQDMPVQSAIATVEGAENGGPVTVKGCVRVMSYMPPRARPCIYIHSGPPSTRPPPPPPFSHTQTKPNQQTQTILPHSYAYAGGGRGIARVDISVDGGQTWETATIKHGGWKHGDYSRTW